MCLYIPYFKTQQSNLMISGSEGLISLTEGKRGRKKKMMTTSKEPIKMELFDNSSVASYGEIKVCDRCGEGVNIEMNDKGFVANFSKPVFYLRIAFARHVYLCADCLRDLREAIGPLKLLMETGADTK
jgi:hypothetical protein